MSLAKQCSSYVYIGDVQPGMVFGVHCFGLEAGPNECFGDLFQVVSIGQVLEYYLEVLARYLCGIYLVKLEWIKCSPNGLVTEFKTLGGFCC